MSVKEQMLQAKEFIQAKRYDEARAILQKVDHPAARDWLAKLDAIEERRQQESAAASSSPESEEEALPISSAQKVVMWIFGLSAVITVFAFLFLPWLRSSSTRLSGLDTALSALGFNSGGRGIPSRELVLFTTWIVPFVVLNILMVVTTVLRKGKAPVRGTWRYFLILGGLAMIHFGWLLLRLLFSGDLGLLGFGYWLGMVGDVVILGVAGTLVYVKRTPKT